MTGEQGAVACILAPYLMMFWVVMRREGMWLALRLFTGIGAILTLAFLAVVAVARTAAI